MFYVTTRLSPQEIQLTLDEFLGFSAMRERKENKGDKTSTRTYGGGVLPPRFRLGDCVKAGLVNRLKRFNAEYAGLRNADRHSLYREFYIPKKSGGFRKIDAPNDQLMFALRELKNIFETDFKIDGTENELYHTAAFAYIHGRCTVDAIKRHQNNESKWFAKFDFTNFFGSTTEEFVMKQLKQIYPFCEICSYPSGEEALKTAIDLAFLDGGLPQGTPISPLITNIIMIPIDFYLCNTLRDFNKQYFVYTRYADDIQVSSKYDFNPKEVEKLIIDTLHNFGAPFILKPEKTRYGSSSGRNFNLGLMLNKENKITVGSNKKRIFRAAITNFIRDSVAGNLWELNDLQVLNGQWNYYESVEGEDIANMVAHIGRKFGVNVNQMLKEQMSALT